MMPYIDAFFMPRAMGDRPDIVPEGAVNFAFLGQFAETGRHHLHHRVLHAHRYGSCVHPAEHRPRCAEVWGTTYDVRALIDATVKLRDGKKITDMDLPLIPRLALKEALKKIEAVPTLRNSSRNIMRFELVALIHFGIVEKQPPAFAVNDWLQMRAFLLEKGIMLHKSVT